ncbi:MAG: S-methyl-5-thioribose kinase [Rhodospirillales bacterium]|nr:MAG: S-methyl-5-thioribose kinase [Rhodospirillales bacterium]
MTIHLPDGYAILTTATVRDAVAKVPNLTARLGGPASTWEIREIGDGNMNLVFDLVGPAGGLIVKQSLPYIRSVGESWPFPIGRIGFEHAALIEQARVAPGRVPAVWHYDGAMALIGMERLSPHIILRKGLVRGIRYPRLADQLGAFLARSLFLTSDLALSTPEKKALMARFAGNAELCATTEDVIFTGPYDAAAPLNRWTRPHLDSAVAALRSDADAIAAAAELKLVFRTATEALIHGDLHTGSIMVDADDTRVIDPEWAFHGPMGFDLGAVIGNLLLAYFSQPGHATATDDRVGYREWILDLIVRLWTRFEADFIGLWRGRRSELLPPSVPPDSEVAERMYARRVSALLADATGFAGAKMIRRLIGISHVEDFEAIADPATRARCEAAALACARDLRVRRAGFRDIGAVVDAARAIGADQSR